MVPIADPLSQAAVAPCLGPHNVQETVQRVTGKRFAPPLVVCNEEHRFIIAEQLRELEIAPT